ncbi:MULTISPECIES: glycosyltransferase [unclassified Arcicella]|uniref:glycosyltransferase family 2 protein n=1 Tax=unclassified Arcicella TaxID=2644986 RepID=UPI002857D958|nr:MULTISPECIES: glycosyltransferase [unclassified Arcicella]MDR6562915.1 glycosyltransferase involved in cell wall biosynthesis [Arcicella sp. BE51]MDR6812998.1 glycosyltransferase involved in cell wall biosynthesis [Arcicella sp. BE140]MDR6824312.1 glycosyltransferase involved in cell wall biosynthesis [Arcicella sp. BE139]
MSEIIKPEVSILVTVYNHEHFLRECLDSLVNQVTNFKFEIVIGEDCSPDSSRSIVIEYANKYPDIIVPLLYEVNQGSKKCPGKGNFVNTFYQCKGRYIVHIEGDDYLINNNKLQMEYDFLEQNPEASACFHNAIMAYEDGSGRPNENINPPDQKDKIYPEDLLTKKEVWFMATASVMFRRHLIGEKFPDWFLLSKSGDIPLYLLLSSKGYIGYLPEVMCVYRRHLGGMSYTDSNLDEVFIKNRMFMYSNVDKELGYKYTHLIKPILGEYYLLLTNVFKIRNQYFQSIYFAFISLYLSRPNSSKHLKDVLQTFIIPYGLMKVYANVKWKIETLFGKKGSQ